ncbi:MAG TPA: DNA topoisomerase I [Nitrososphaerales archaeon]|nr:DNA topoisomerase I [Nitrososphaerales archaeon]
MAVWRTLTHKGIAFPDPYVPRGLSVRVLGQELKLSPIAEEMAYQFAKKKDTPYVQDPVFVANFMKYFVKELPPSGPKQAKFQDFDFSQFYRLVDEEKKDKETMTKEAKKSLAASRKEKREKLREVYGKALLDGKEIEVANWMAEPPGLFMGRGLHPIRGSWKPRVSPSEVTLNLGEDAPKPLGEWGSIVHDHESIWIARWIDKLTEKEKYVWPHESSDIQQSRNKEKYDKALRIGERLPKLQATIRKRMDEKDEKTRKIATVSCLIDEVGMRVGDEKDEDEADTVGATTLRVEHIKRLDDQAIVFDFLGKDSVRWVKTMDAPDPALVRNMKRFTAGKKPDAQIFDGVTSGHVNAFLSGIVDGHSAKVFRTYHATKTVEESLGSKDVRKEDDFEKLRHAKLANLDAAIYCNHKRTIPKTWEAALEKKKQKLAEYRAAGKDERVKKLEMDIDLTERTKEYNLNTSMKNYIDPRTYKAWGDYVGLDWTKLYSKSLQRKFSWVAQSKKTWPEAKPTDGAPVPKIESP